MDRYEEDREHDEIRAEEIDPTRVAPLSTEALHASEEATKTWFAVWEDGADEGSVTSRKGPAWPVEGGWTYQDVHGAHGRVIYEGHSEDDAWDALRAAEQRACVTTPARPAREERMREIRAAEMVEDDAYEERPA